MKTIFSAVLLIICFMAQAQLKYKYNNPKLEIPGWLTDKDYIANHTSDYGAVIIEELDLKTIKGNYVVKIHKSEYEHNNGEDMVYLATFDKNKNIKDLIYVDKYSNNDWEGTEGADFDAIGNDSYKYMAVKVKRKPAETEEEKEYGTGLAIASRDTIISYYKIMNTGSIFSADELEGLADFVDDETDIVEVEDNTDVIDIENDILKIRQVFNQTNKNQANFEKKQKKSGENISLTYFYEGNVLKKLFETNSSNGQSLDYYYDNGMLVFIYAHNKTKNTESRYYFKDNKMIRWLKGSEREQISTGSSEFMTKEKDLLSRSGTLSKN